MLVKATKAGYLGKLRQPGEVFDCGNAQAFSSKWMEIVPVEQFPAPAVAVGKPAALAEVPAKKKRARKTKASPE